MKARELRENEEQAGKHVIYQRAHLARDDDDDACHHDEKTVMLPSQDRANMTTDVRPVYLAFMQKKKTSGKIGMRRAALCQQQHMQSILSAPCTGTATRSI